MSMCFLRAALLVVSASYLSSCFSPKFNAAWKAAENKPGSAQKWAGRWESEKGTGGRLRAVLKEPQNGVLDVYFEAGWHGFTTAYPVALRADPKAAGFDVSGEHELKSFIGGGLYKYDGTLSSDKFSVRYASRYDTGMFTLHPEKSH